MGQEIITSTVVKVYQGHFKYFYSSGYMIIKEFYTNIYSTHKLCKINLDKIKINFQVMSWDIKEYIIDSDFKPLIIEN